MAFDERDALVDGIRRWRPRNGNTGVSGIGLPGGVAAPPLDPGAPLADDLTKPPAAAPEPAAAAPAAQSYAMRGFDAGKMGAPADQQSEKYKIGNVMKGFDPKAGVTPEMLAALNALGIAEFSGGGDKLTVNNTKNDPRFGKGGTADVVYGLKGQNADTAWQPWFVDDGGSAPAGAGVPGSSFGASDDASTFASLAPTDSDFFKRLQDQAAEILGGYPSMDRNALLKMLSAGGR